MKGCRDVGGTGRTARVPCKADQCWCEVGILQEGLLDGVANGLHLGSISSAYIWGLGFGACNILFGARGLQTRGGMDQASFEQLFVCQVSAIVMNNAADRRSNSVLKESENGENRAHLIREGRRILFLHPLDVVRHPLPLQT